MGGGRGPLADRRASFPQRRAGGGRQAKAGGAPETSTREGIIMDFLDRQVPEDWQSWPLDRRRMFWGGAVQGEVKLVDRDRCVPWRCGVRPWTASSGTSATPTRRKSTASLRLAPNGRKAGALCALATAENSGAFSAGAALTPEHWGRNIARNILKMEFQCSGSCSG